MTHCSAVETTGRVADDVALRRGDRASQLGTDAVQAQSTPTLVPGQALRRDVPSCRRAGADRPETFHRVIPIRRPRRVGLRADVERPDDREFKYRMPGGRRRRGDGPPSIFQTVPTIQSVKMVWRLRCPDAVPRSCRPAVARLGGDLDGEYDRGTDMTTFYGSPPLQKDNRLAVNELRRTGARG